MEKRNVIVVMLDSLQFNYLGCYGNKWIKTPNIDRLAKEGILFENNYIEGLPTVPCRRSMHGGRFYLPTKGWSPLELEDTTIADLCWGRPIDTALIFDCPMYRQVKFGYTRGFDKVYFLHGHEGDADYYAKDPLYHLDPRDYIEDHVLEAVNKAGTVTSLGPLMDEVASYLRQRQYWKTDEDQNVAQVMKKAVQYLENRDKNKSFFLWVDSFDPHEPWDSPSVYDPDMPCPYDPDYKGKDMFLPPIMPVDAADMTEPELNHIRMLYAEKVTNCDKWLGHLLENVRRLGLEDDTLFMLVSDHGEPMGNGEHGHGIMRKCRPWPYEYLSHAPMLMKGPGLPAGKRVKGFTQSCDVAPTVTDWLGIGVHPSHTGKSLLPLARGDVDKVREFAISGYFRFSAAIYTEDWSYIHWTKPTEGMSHAQIASEMYFSSPVRIAAFQPDTPVGKAAAAKVAEILKDAVKIEQQWTATPVGPSDVPAKDELYDRHADPWQQVNVAKKNPKKSAELLQTLSEFMVSLRKA